MHSYALGNHRTYKLGEEILTPFGRHQLCECDNNLGSHSFMGELVDLGISMRMKYGFLLKVCLLYQIVPALTQSLEFHRNKYSPCIQDGVPVR